MNDKKRDLIPWVVLVAAVGGLVTYRTPCHLPHTVARPEPLRAPRAGGRIQARLLGRASALGPAHDPAEAGG